MLKVSTFLAQKSSAAVATYPDYQEAEVFVRYVKEVNDLSERAIELIQDL